MQEIFYEESSKIANEGAAKRKYYIAKVFMVTSYTLAVIWGMMCVLFLIDFNHILSSLIFTLIPLATFIVSGIFLGKIKDKFYVDYDYTFVSGSVRFSRVIKNVKRRNIIKFETSDIIKIGIYGTESYEKIASTPDIKLKVLTSNDEPSDGKGFYYFAVAVSGERHLFVLECSEAFIVNVLKYTNRTVLDKELIERKK